MDNTNVRFQLNTIRDESQIGPCFVNVARENAGEFGVHLEQICQEQDELPRPPELILSGPTGLDVHKAHPDARDVHAVLVFHKGFQIRERTHSRPE